MATNYPVACGCGRTHSVTGGDAGSKLDCECGRTYEVPSLKTLRMSVGEPTIPPEIMIDVLLQEGQIPGEKECVGCDTPTEEVCYVRITCERAQMNGGSWKINLFALVAGFLFFQKSPEKSADAISATGCRFGCAATASAGCRGRKCSLHCARSISTVGSSTNTHTRKSGDEAIYGNEFPYLNSLK